MVCHHQELGFALQRRDAIDSFSRVGHYPIVTVVMNWSSVQKIEKSKKKTKKLKKSVSHDDSWMTVMQWQLHARKKFQVTPKSTHGVTFIQICVVSSSGWTMTHRRHTHTKVARPPPPLPLLVATLTRIHPHAPGVWMSISHNTLKKYFRLYIQIPSPHPLLPHPHLNPEPYISHAMEFRGAAPSCRLGFKGLGFRV